MQHYIMISRILKYLSQFVHLSQTLSEEEKVDGADWERGDTEMEEPWHFFDLWKLVENMHIFMLQ